MKPVGRAVVVTVVDAQSEEPIEGAVVEVGSLVTEKDGKRFDGRRAVTGPAGSARVTNLPEGRLFVDARHEDYLDP